MQTGTQILLERMKTNPEEFANDGELLRGKWDRILRDARDYLPQEDREALDAAYRQVQVDRYNERVLKTLTGESDEGLIKYRTQERYAAGMTDARALYGAVVKSEGAEVDSFKLVTALGGQQ